MRIGVNSQALGSGARHGFSTYLGNTLRALRSRYREHEFVEWSCLPGPQWRMPHQLWWDQVHIPWQAFRARVDLLHVPAFSGPVLRSCPMVLTVHDLLYTRHPEWLPTQRARWYWGTWIPQTARSAKGIITPSEFTKRDLVELAQVSPDRVHVVPEAIDPLFVARPSREKVRASVTRLVGDAPYILYVGSVDRRKDWWALMEAFALLRRRIPEYRLVIAGHIIPGRSRIHDYIAEFNLADRVHCLGYVPDEELTRLYTGASLFVYPSWFEGFGLPLLEAMAMGVPVITYRTSSIPEVVGDAALLVDPPFAAEELARAMTRVLTDEAYSRELTARGARRVAQFSWERAAEQTMAVYEQCV